MIRTSILAAIAAALALSGSVQAGVKHTPNGNVVATTTPPGSDMQAYLPLDGDPQFYYTMVEHPPGQDAGFINWVHTLHADSAYRMVRGVTYYSSKKGDFDKGKVVVTTIFGVDLDPKGNELAVTGYTPGAPEVDETTHYVVGKSGKSYDPGFSQLIAIQDLPRVLGKDFDLSPFQGDPQTVVRVFQTVPAHDLGTPDKGILLSEDFSQSPHVGDSDGSFGAGFDLTGSLFRVVAGNVDILGQLNGTPTGRCDANPQGNCLDLIGNSGMGAVRSMQPFSLDPKYTYVIQFDVVAQDADSDLHFSVSLGDNFTRQVTATSSVQHIQLSYTPESAEPVSYLNLATLDKVDDIHGPVISNFTLCTRPAGSHKLKC